MKIAIADMPGGFHDGWLDACKRLGVTFKLVNVYATDILVQVADCQGFMWHWNMNSTSDWLFARQLIASLEARGISVFPNSNTCWHFDDKVGQKYLFEALDVPAVPSWVFYDKKSAIDWAKQTAFPKVFKLRGGAGSVNVKLVKNFKEAKTYIKRMFGKGYPQATGFADFSTKIRKHRKNRDIIHTILHTMPKVVGQIFKRNTYPDERGYVYFQEFAPGNTYDTRIIVIGDRAFAMRRYCRPKDFRASGSGAFSYKKENFSVECLKLAFESAKKMKMQCAAFDFVKTIEGKDLIVEVSYGFIPSVYTGKCEGYWTSDLVWHDAPIAFEQWMVENLVKDISRA